MSSVYTFGPTFRAEKSHSRRHLAEFYMVEAETVTPQDSKAGLDVLMRLIEGLIASTVTAVQGRDGEDLEVLAKQAEGSRK